MEQRIKERLLGAVVLGAVAVLVVPMLLDGPPPQAPVVSLRVPPAPEVPAMPVEPPAGDDDAAPWSVAVPPLPDTESPPASPRAPPEVPPASPEPPVASVPPPPAAWIVQLGSFASEDKAVALRDRLRKEGFSAYVEPVIDEGRTLFRVRVGPEVDRKRADAMRDRLAKRVPGSEPVVRSHP